MAIIGTRTAKAIVAVCIDLGIKFPDGHYKIRRTRAGHHQRSGGTWSWSLEGPYHHDGSYHGSIMPIGSQSPATEVIRAHKQGRVCLYKEHFSDTELIIEPEKP
jgi:hypothetical protein